MKRLVMKAQIARLLMNSNPNPTQTLPLQPKVTPVAVAIRGRGRGRGAQAPSSRGRGAGRGRGALKLAAADFLVSSQTSQTSQSRKRNKISPEKSKSSEKFWSLLNSNPDSDDWNPTQLSLELVFTSAIQFNTRECTNLKDLTPM